MSRSRAPPPRDDDDEHQQLDHLIRKLHTLEPTIRQLLLMRQQTATVEKKLTQLEDWIIEIPEQYEQVTSEWRSKLAHWWRQYAEIDCDLPGGRGDRGGQGARMNLSDIFEDSSKMDVSKPPGKSQQEQKASAAEISISKSFSTDMNNNGDAAGGGGGGSNLSQADEKQIKELSKSVEKLATLWNNLSGQVSPCASPGPGLSSMVVGNGDAVDHHVSSQQQQPPPPMQYQLLPMVSTGIHHSPAPSAFAAPHLHSLYMTPPGAGSSMLRIEAPEFQARGQFDVQQQQQPLPQTKDFGKVNNFCWRAPPPPSNIGVIGGLSAPSPPPGPSVINNKTYYNNNMQQSSLSSQSSWWRNQLSPPGLAPAAAAASMVNGSDSAVGQMSKPSVELVASSSPGISSLRPTSNVSIHDPNGRDVDTVAAASKKAIRDHLETVFNEVVSVERLSPETMMDFQAILSAVENADRLVKPFWKDNGLQSAVLNLAFRRLPSSLLQTFLNQHKLNSPKTIRDLRVYLNSELNRYKKRQMHEQQQNRPMSYSMIKEGGDDDSNKNKTAVYCTGCPTSSTDSPNVTSSFKDGNKPEDSKLSVICYKCFKTGHSLAQCSSANVDSSRSSIDSGSGSNEPSVDV